MLGDELTIDLKTSSSKLTSKNNEKVKAKYNTEKLNNVKKNKKKPKIIFENKGLEVLNLGKRYKNRPILRGINLQVKKGEIVGLLGS